jgi:hypothetical protein
MKNPKFKTSRRGIFALLAMPLLWIHIPASLRAQDKTKTSNSSGQVRPNVAAAPKDQDIKGPDSNGDGIRDSVNQYLRKLITDDAQRRTMEDLERKFVIALQNVDDKETSSKKSMIYFDSLECAEMKFGKAFAQLRSQVVEESIDTESRLKAYMKMNANLGGITYQAPTAAELAAKCKGTGK